MTATVAERVAKGAALLDEREPGWDRKIDLVTLNLHATCRCVLGQLTADLEELDGIWGSIVARFGLQRASSCGDLGTDAEHGFNADGAQSQEQYNELTAEWKRLITERRAAS